MSNPSRSLRSNSLSRLNRWLIAAIALTAVGHFLVVNDLSTKGFLFKDLKSKTNDLTAERVAMESSLSTIGSYENMTSRIQSLKLVAADNVRYLSGEEKLVAKK